MSIDGLFDVRADVAVKLMVAKTSIMERVQQAAEGEAQVRTGTVRIRRPEDLKPYMNRGGR